MCSSDLPPEYRNGGKISEKNDVFSLGVVMIDIMEGPEGYSLFYEMGATDFKEQVTKVPSLYYSISCNKLPHADYVLSLCSIYYHRIM